MSLLIANPPLSPMREEPDAEKPRKRARLSDIEEETAAGKGRARLADVEEAEPLPEVTPFELQSAGLPPLSERARRTGTSPADRPRAMVRGQFGEEIPSLGEEAIETQTARARAAGRIGPRVSETDYSLAEPGGGLALGEEVTKMLFAPGSFFGPEERPPEPLSPVEATQTALEESRRPSRFGRRFRPDRFVVEEYSEPGYQPPQPPTFEEARSRIREEEAQARATPVPGQKPLLRFEEAVDFEEHPRLYGAAEALSGLTTPESALILTGAAGLGGGVMGRLLSGGFSAEMVNALYEQNEAFRQAVDRGDVQEAERIVGQASVTGPMMFLTGKHALQSRRFAGRAGIAPEPARARAETVERAKGLVEAEVAAPPTPEAAQPTGRASLSDIESAKQPVRSEASAPARGVPNFFEMERGTLEQQAKAGVEGAQRELQRREAREREIGMEVTGEREALERLQLQQLESRERIAEAEGRTSGRGRDEVVVEPAEKKLETSEEWQEGDYAKVAVRDEKTGEAENLWVKVRGFDNEQQVIHGTLDSQPVAIKGLKLGQEVRVSYDNIIDHQRFEETAKGTTSSVQPTKQAVQPTERAKLADIEPLAPEEVKATTRPQQLLREAQELLAKETARYGEDSAVAEALRRSIVKLEGKPELAGHEQVAAWKEELSGLESKFRKGRRHGEVFSEREKARAKELRALIKRSKVGAGEVAAKPSAAKYDPEVLEFAESQVKGASELIEALPETGKSFFSPDEGTSFEQMRRSLGGEAPYSLYGPGQRKRHVAGQFPWYSQQGITPKLLNEAIAYMQAGKTGKGGAAYNKVVDAIGQWVEAERAEAKPVIEEFAPTLRTLAEQVKDVDAEMSASLTALAEGKWYGTRDIRATIERYITDAERAAKFSQSWDELTEAAQEVGKPLPESAAERAPTGGRGGPREGETPTEQFARETAEFEAANRELAGQVESEQLSAVVREGKPKPLDTGERPISESPLFGGKEEGEPTLFAGGFLNPRTWARIFRSKPQVQVATPRLQQVQAARQTPPPSPIQVFLDRVRAFPTDFTRKFVNQFVDIRHLAQDVEARIGRKLRPEENPEIVNDLVFGGTGGRVEAAAMDYAEVVKQAHDAGLLDAVRNYLDLRGFDRALRIMEERIADAQAKGDTATVQELQQRLGRHEVVPVGYDRTTIAADTNTIAQQLGPQRFAEVQRLAERINGLNRQAWDLAHAEGIISDEVYIQGIRRGNDYIPMERIMDAADETAALMRQNLSLRDQKVLKRLEGSKRVTKDPIEASMEKHAETIREAGRNEAARTLVNLAQIDPQGFGQLVRELRPGQKVPRGMGTISYYENGVRRIFAMPDVYADAMNLANAAEVNVAGSTYRRIARRVFQAGATTANLGFSLPNVLRDIQEFAVLSKAGAKNPVDFMRLVGQWSNSLRQTMIQDPMYKEFLRSRAAFSTLQKNIDPKPFLQKELGMTTPLQKVNPVRIIHGIEHFNNLLEESTKLTSYKRARGTGMSEMEAAWETRRYGGSPDFARRGTLSPELNLTFMFFNAQVQGITRMARLLTTPRRVLAMLAGVSAAEMALYSWNQQFRDEKGEAEWDHIPDSDKKNYWVIIRPDTYQSASGRLKHGIIKVRKGDVFQLMANPIQTAIESAFGGTPDVPQVALDTLSGLLPGGGRLERRDLAGSAARGVMSSLNPVLREPLEQLGNIDAFRNTPIVPERFKDVIPEEQWTDLTSPTAVALGRQIRVSPLRVEHAIRGFMAGLGEAGLSLADAFVDTRGRIPLEGDEELAHQKVVGPILRRFVGSASDQKERDLERKFYDFYERARESQRTYNVLRKTDAAQAREFISDRERLVLANIDGDLQKAATKLSQIREAIRRAGRDQRMDDAQKKRTVQFLYKQRMRILEHITTAVERIIEAKAKRNR